MNEHKGFVTRLGEMMDQYRAERQSRSGERPDRRTWLSWMGRQLVPNIGTLILVVVLLLTVPSLAAPRATPQTTSTSTISYQGRLANNLGEPLTGYYDLSFRIYDSPTATEPLWTEDWDNENSVAVSDGLFNVMLGSINPTLADSIADHNELYLGIQVNQDLEMAPRVQLGSVPFSMQAMTVPDLSITTEKIADGAVTQAKLGSDIVLVPPFEGFSYHMYDFSKPAGWVTLTPTIEDFNTFGSGSYNPATGTFTAPKAGYYRFMSYGFIGTASANNDRIALSLNKNGGPLAVSGGQFSAGDTPGPHFSHIAYLQVGEAVSISAYTPIDCNFGGGYGWFFQGEYLGE